MKKVISIFLLCVCLITSFCSCEKINDLVDGIIDGNINYTEGLGSYVIEDSECVVSIGSAKELEKIVIPKKIDGNKVVAIDERGFAFLENLKTVSVPKGVYYIGDEAFMYSSALEEISLPEGVTHIGRSAFNGCRALREIKLSEGLTEIEERTFYFCNSLTHIDLPSTLTSIGTNAFTGCAFTEVTIPEGVTYIGEYAFSGCQSLKKVYIPESARVSRYVFNVCDSLETVVYGGTREQWEEMMRDNQYGTEDKCYDGVEIVFEK